MNEIQQYNNTDKFFENDEELKIGQWVWVKVQDDDIEDYAEVIGSPDKENNYLWFACITDIGSNYIKVESSKQRYSSSARIHNEEINKRIIIENNPRKVIQDNINNQRNNIDAIFFKINELTKRLGISINSLLENNSSVEEQHEITALVINKNNEGVKSYRNELELAKDKTLPEYFKNLKDTQEIIADWMTMEATELKAYTGLYNGAIDKVKNRIFNLDLYAGLSETIEHIHKGKTATIDDKVYLMQRMLFMDEECLLNYETGGMEFNDIHQFDNWLLRKENFERCLPFPKTITAFRIRRSTKDRDISCINDIFINIKLAEADESTYLYIRNGENLYRIITDLPLSEKIFPDQDYYKAPNELMFKKDWKQYDFISIYDYKAQVKQKKERIRNYAQWEKENPFEEWKKTCGKSEKDWNLYYVYKHENPFYSFSNDISESDWTAFTKESVYYDDALKSMTDEMTKYNRIALIIQGILDRTLVLHPHRGIKTSNQNSFQTEVKLIYDGSTVLYEKEVPPDIKAYIETCNSQADADSVWIRQYDIWQEKERRKEEYRRNNDWRWNNKDTSVYKGYTPFGNPGPSRVSKAHNFMKRARKVTFKWFRDRNTWNDKYGNYVGNKPVSTSITIPIEQLFNISAYKKGDYLQFFNDPRTRQNYLFWANLLLSAEEYHAGNIELVDTSDINNYKK